MKPNISPQHEALIRHFLLSDPTEETAIQGRKLIALHRLIQMKGETIDTADPKLHGLKAYQFSQTEYIAMKHVPTTVRSFFPCVIKSHLLSNL
jgi:hypothetical protein